MKRAFIPTGRAVNGTQSPRPGKHKASFPALDGSKAGQCHKAIVLPRVYSGQIPHVTEIQSVHGLVPTTRKHLIHEPRPPPQANLGTQALQGAPPEACESDGPRCLTDSNSRGRRTQTKTPTWCRKSPSARRATFQRLVFLTHSYLLDTP